MKFATLLTPPSSVYISRTPFSNIPQWAQWSKRKWNIICTMVMYGVVSRLWSQLAFFINPQRARYIDLCRIWGDNDRFRAMNRRTAEPASSRIRTRDLLARSQECFTRSIEKSVRNPASNAFLNHIIHPIKPNKILNKQVDLVSWYKIF